MNAHKQIGSLLLGFYRALERATRSPPDAAVGRPAVDPRGERWRPGIDPAADAAVAAARATATTRPGFAWQEDMIRVAPGSRRGIACRVVTTPNPLDPLEPGEGGWMRIDWGDTRYFVDAATNRCFGFNPGGRGGDLFFDDPRRDPVPHVR